MTLKPAKLLLVLLATAAPAFAQNLATVNGKGIPAARVDAMVKQLVASGQQQDTPQVRAAVKQELINREVMIQEAEKAGLAKNAEVVNQLDLARQQILIRALMIEHLKKNPIADAEIQAEYDKAKALTGDKEYHVYHILVDKEDDAKAIISKLKSGAKFDELAKQSKDTGSAQRGGDLDWVSPNLFVPAFAQAMTALQKGQFTETPVKTENGYHVIKLDDVRAAKFPAFDEIKPQIVDMLQQQRVQNYQQALIKKAKIQ